MVYTLHAIYHANSPPIINLTSYTQSSFAMHCGSNASYLSLKKVIVIIPYKNTDCSLAYIVYSEEGSGYKVDIQTFVRCKWLIDRCVVLTHCQPIPNTIAIVTLLCLGGRSHGAYSSRVVYLCVCVSVCRQDFSSLAEN